MSVVSTPVRTTRHSENNEWATPTWLFEALSERIPFTVDLCATADNRLMPRFGFGSVSADDVAWMNPPYGRDLAWCMFAVQELHRTRQLRAAVCLVPVRTSTEWWHEARLHSRRTVFVRGRLRFGGSEVNAPFDSALVVYGSLPRIEAVVALKGRERVQWG